MKTEQILTEINRAAALLDEDERGSFSYIVKNRLYSVPFDTPGAILGLLAVTLTRDIENSAARSAGTLNQKRALERIVKNAKERGARSSLFGSFPTKSGMRAVCDGIRAVRVKNTDIIMPDPVPEDKEPMDVDDCFPDMNSLQRCTLPNAADLRAALKVARAEFNAQHPGRKKPRFLTACKLIGADGVEIYVDGEFLLDMLEALPGSVGYCGRSRNSIVVFEASDGDGLLCHIRYDPNDETTTKKYKLLNI